MRDERRAVQAMLLSPQTSFCLPDQAAIDSQLMPAMECKLSHAWGVGGQQGFHRMQLAKCNAATVLNSRQSCVPL